MEDEMLVAFIDSDAGDFQSEIILTTARVYWSERDLGAASVPNRAKSPVVIRANGMDYALFSREKGAIHSCLLRPERGPRDA